MSQLAAIRAREAIRQVPWPTWTDEDGMRWHQCPHCGHRQLDYPEIEMDHGDSCPWVEAERSARTDREALFQIVERAVRLLDELEDEGGYHDNETKELAFRGGPLPVTDEGDPVYSKVSYYTAIREMIDAVGWTRRQPSPEMGDSRPE